MDTASLVLVVLRLSEAKNKHTVSQSPVLNVSLEPCISPPNRNERREEKNRLCSAHKCKVYINTESQGSSGGANSPAVAKMPQFPDFCSKQYVLVMRGSSKDCSSKDLFPLSMIFPFFLLPHSLNVPTVTSMHSVPP